MGGESLEAAWLTTSEKDSGSKWLLGRAQQLLGWTQDQIAASGT